MADTAEKGKLSGEIEEVYDPDENLALWIQQSGQKQKSEFEDKRKKKYEEEEQEKNKEEGEENKEVDLGEALETLEEKYLKSLIEEDEREARLKDVENQKKSSEYQEKKGDLERARQLLEQLKKQRQEHGEPHPNGEFSDSDKEIVRKYMEFEKKLTPYADKMAQSWLEVVNNIASKIEAVKDKYYRSGKVDIKKFQKHFPEIELGMEVEQRLIYERIVEKIITEVKPQMLRIGLLIDNSGSMAGRNWKTCRWLSCCLIHHFVRSDCFSKIRCRKFSVMITERTMISFVTLKYVHSEIKTIPS